MPLYSYVKKRTSTKKKAVEYVSYLSLTAGAMLLFWSVYPVLSFEIYSRLFIQNNVQTPIPRNQMVTALDEASILGTNTAYSSNLRDFTNVKLWFPAKQAETVAVNLNIKEYSLSIPKINIKNAVVKVGGEDLSQSIIQYLPETIPGQDGNSVLFGHSTLPALYNPKDYKTIFTYLPTLEKGDKVYVTVGGVEYAYEIFDKFVVKPEQISVLEQRKDGSYLTLITCCPPGTYWNRCVLRARLSDLPNKL